jgi:hypothetical protein
MLAWQYYTSSVDISIMLHLKASTQQQATTRKACFKRINNSLLCVIYLMSFGVIIRTMIAQVNPNKNIENIVAISAHCLFVFGIEGLIVL